VDKVYIKYVRRYLTYIKLSALRHVYKINSVGN